jgi:hypothetical protein
MQEKFTAYAVQGVTKVSYFGMILTNQNCMLQEMRRRLKSENACHHLAWKLFLSGLLSKNIKVKICKTIILPVIFGGCETSSHIEGTAWAEGCPLSPG